MTPNDPESRPIFGIPETAPPPVSVASRYYPPWDYSDLGFFVSLGVPTLLVSALVVRAISAFFPLAPPVQGLIAQLLWYALVFSGLYVLLRVRYGLPFWTTLGWNARWLSAGFCFAAGPVLAITIGLLGTAIRTPEIQLPFQQMFGDRATTILFAVFVCFLGPLAEELAFRGFLMPLLIRSWGAAAGIVVTGLFFGSLHGYEYAWSWRHILLVSTAGIVFGIIRYRTGSTAAAFYMHSSYNLTQFAAFLIQTRPL
jgi:membrane protease YdiL (CAAX protease family)